MTTRTVGEWEDPVRPLCPRFHVSDPCDCGYDGDWQRRWIYDKLPCGHTTLTGYDEKCPSCGDIERFSTLGVLSGVFGVVPGSQVEQRPG